eukprot:Polyplicarium_translucidae@DN2878_c0_g1_i10.p1
MPAGDFRLSKIMEEEVKNLVCPARCRTSGRATFALDEVHLDNTFCHPRFTFPPQADVEAEIIECLRCSWPCDAVIATHSLGKEALFIKLATEFDAPLLVSPERFVEMQQMGLSCDTLAAEPYLAFENFGTERGRVPWREWLGRGRLLVVPKKAARALVRRMQGDLRGRKAVVLLELGGWSYPTEDWRWQKAQGVEIAFPYSCHSSFLELIRFLAITNPRVVSLNCPLPERPLGCVGTSPDPTEYDGQEGIQALWDCTNAREVKTLQRSRPWGSQCPRGVSLASVAARVLAVPPLLPKRGKRMREASPEESGNKK